MTRRSKTRINTQHSINLLCLTSQDEGTKVKSQCFQKRRRKFETGDKGFPNNEYKQCRLREEQLRNIDVCMMITSKNECELLFSKSYTIVKEESPNYLSVDNTEVRKQGFARGGENTLFELNTLNRA